LATTLLPRRNKSLIKSIKNFYYYSNAFDILRPLKRKYEDYLDPQLDADAKRIEMRMRFYLGYVKQQNRHLPPFHELYWTGPMVNDIQESAETVNSNSNPSTSQKSRPAPIMTYKQKRVCEKNENKPLEVPTSNENSNASTVVEVIVNEGTNQVNNHSQLTVHKLLDYKQKKCN
jgi:hypothetical protein